MPLLSFSQALRVAGLAEMVAAFPKKLEHPITDEGGGKMHLFKRLHITASIYIMPSLVMPILVLYIIV